MKWQVCSVGNWNGTEVMGTVEADSEMEAAQRANEQFRPTYDGEDIIIRPLVEDHRVPGGDRAVVSSYTDFVGDEEVDEEESSDKYEFIADWDTWNKLSKDQIEITIEREHLCDLLSELLNDGLGRKKEKFSFTFSGKLRRMEL